MKLSLVYYSVETLLFDSLSYENWFTYCHGLEFCLREHKSVGGKIMALPMLLDFNSLNP